MQNAQSRDDETDAADGHELQGIYFGSRVFKRRPQGVQGRCSANRQQGEQGEEQRQAQANASALDDRPIGKLNIEFNGEDLRENTRAGDTVCPHRGENRSPCQ